MVSPAVVVSLYIPEYGPLVSSVMFKELGETPSIRLWISLASVLVMVTV